jgi:steroid 5-alpha reductase family enzyme
MTVATLLIDNFAILAAVFVLLWLLSIALKDASFVDIWWAFGMVFLAGLSFFETGPPSLRKYLLLGLCALWGLRLGFYILWRWLKHGPDQRYVAMLESRQKKHGWSFAKTSGLIVFTLQMPLQFIVALPVQLGMASPEPAGIGIVGWIGVALSAFGIVFESIADFHLAIFKANPANKGKVLDSGVWRTTRHPNFFGEACAWWALPGPILITFLLTRFSGVPTVEESMHAKRPGYEAYVKRTSGFIPWFPKKI